MTARTDGIGNAVTFRGRVCELAPYIGSGASAPQREKRCVEREMQCLHSGVRQFVLEPPLSECRGNGRGLGSSVCVRVRELRALSGRSADEEECCCELREFIRGSFDFELVMSIVVDKNLEEASGLETSRSKF
jgi:hypothetical protein